MLAAARKDLLLDRLRRDGRIVAKEIAAELGLSEDSIGRDLRDLDAAGLAVRAWGGALPASPAVVDYAARTAVAPDSKRRVAAVAASLIEPGATVILDGGTTSLAPAGSDGDHHEARDRADRMIQPHRQRRLIRPHRMAGGERRVSRRRAVIVRAHEMRQLAPSVVVARVHDVVCHRHRRAVMIAMRSHHDPGRRPTVTDGVRQQVGEHLTQLRLFEAHAAAALIDHLQRHPSGPCNAEEHGAHVREGRRHLHEARVLVVRVIEDALSNALRHGSADHVVISARESGGILLVVVGNTGSAPPATPALSGLARLRRRAQVLGGELLLEPLHGGARAPAPASSSTLPLSEESAGDAAASASATAAPHTPPPAP